ncbi:MAG: hypothetical protein ACT4OE_05725, partial [Sphingosinicella sp.]
MKKLWTAGLGAASLIAVAALLAPASAETGARAPGAAGRPIGAVTPAVYDPPHAAARARRGRRP